MRNFEDPRSDAVLQFTGFQVLVVHYDRHTHLYDLEHLRDA